GLRGQSLGTREDDLGTPNTEGIRSAAVGLQLPMLIIGQGADKEWWFHSPSRSFDDYREVACLDTSPSVLLDGAMHKGSCGNALDIMLCPHTGLCKRLAARLAHASECRARGRGSPRKPGVTIAIAQKARAGVQSRGQAQG